MFLDLIRLGGDMDERNKWLLVKHDALDTNITFFGSSHGSNLTPISPSIQY